MMPPDREVLVATRRALHVVAEHVLMPDLHDATCRIGLRVAADGVSTPPYERRDGTTRRLHLDGTDVVDERDGAERARVPLAAPRSLGEVRRRLGIEAEAPGDIYDLGSPGDPDQLLVLDPAAVDVLARLFAIAQTALEALRAEAAGDPSPIQLWPEHLDLACSIDRVNYGASPGDATHPEPYLYVGPWDPAPAGPFWNELFGASRVALPVPGADDALAFFREGRDRLAAGG